MTMTTLTKTIFLKASRKTVWEFLTNKDKLADWFHPADSNLEADKDYALRSRSDGNKICWGAVELWNPVAELVYSFTVGPLGGVETKVRWLLEEVGEGTKLTMVHSDLPVEGEGFTIVTSFDKGWDKHLGSMRDMLTTE